MSLLGQGRGGGWEMGFAARCRSLGDGRRVVKREFMVAGRSTRASFHSIRSYTDDRSSSIPILLVGLCFSTPKYAPLMSTCQPNAPATQWNFVHRDCHAFGDAVRNLSTTLRNRRSEFAEQSAAVSGRQVGQPRPYGQRLGLGGPVSDPFRKLSRGQTKDAFPFDARHGRSHRRLHPTTNHTHFGIGAMTRDDRPVASTTRNALK